MIYISVDGDNVGRLMEKYILIEDEKGVSETSNYIKQAILNIADIFSSAKYEIIYCAGDSLLCRAVEINTELILNILRTEKRITFSIGVGKSMRDAYIALKYAKSCGKGVLIIFENDILKLIKDV